MRGRLRSSWSIFILAFFTLGRERSAHGAPFDPNDSTWQGCSELAEIAKTQLGHDRVVVGSPLRWSTLTPADGLLLLHPEHLLDTDSLGAFLHAGGRVAVLDDYGRGDRILERYRIRRVPAPATPLLMLRNNPQLAIAEPVRERLTGTPGNVHPVVAGVTQLMTNHPTGFEHPDLSPVLRIRARAQPDATLALAGQVGRGRLFAMGDPSAVINLMLRYPGNRSFAEGLVRYLVEDDTWGARTGKLYLFTNDLEETGTYGNSSRAFLQQIQAWARTMRSALQRASAEGLPKPIVLSLALLAATGMLLWVASVAARTYRQPVPRFARAVPLVAQGGAAGRAAVLAAPSTHRGLILLEQKHALEEHMAALLELTTPPSIATLLDEITKRNLLDGSPLHQLKDLFLTMAQVETAVLAGSPLRVSRTQLVKAERISDHVLEALRERLRGSRA